MTALPPPCIFLSVVLDHPRYIRAECTMRPASVAVSAVNEFECNLQAYINNAMCPERMDIARSDK